jgi:hypothetical protein
MSTTSSALQHPKRYRGFVLTATGWQKLQQGIQQLEGQTQMKQNARTLAERVQLSTPEGIHPMTVRKILQCQQGVDRRSIEQVFTTLELALTEGDYAHRALSQDSEQVPDRKILPMHSEILDTKQLTNDISLEADAILNTMILNSSNQVLTLIKMVNGYCMIVTNT